MKEIIWQAPAYMYKEKSSDFYWIVGIISVTLTVISIIFGDIILAILIVIGSITMSLNASVKPKIIDIKLNQRGIQINDLFYEYKNLNGFWIEENELHPRIILRSVKTFSPYIIALIDPEVDTNILREFLLQYVFEEKMSESFLEKLLIHIGF